MARQARRKSSTGIYHITVRGIDKMDLFLDDEERQMYLSILARCKGECKGEGKFLLHAYCLMSNHVHLLLQEQEDHIDLIMKRIGVMYAKWFNARYDRHGPLFEDRFASEGIEDEAYFLAALRYIHRNPVKAGRVARYEDWAWSSAREYASGQRGLADKDFVYGLFAEDLAGALAEYSRFMEEEDERPFLEVRDRDAEILEARQMWQELEAKGLTPEERLAQFLQKVKLPLRTLEAITGVGRGKLRGLRATGDGDF